MKELLAKIENKTANVVVMGAGYVGLALAETIQKAGIPVWAFDTSAKRVEEVRDRVRATSNPAVLGNADVILICVPTPLDENRQPDNSYIEKAAHLIYEYRRANENPVLVVLESTTSPGYTRSELRESLSGQEWQEDKNFYLAFSPERVDPENKTWNVQNTPKLVGGNTPDATALATAFYRTFVEKVVQVPSPDVAEMAKLFENTFRAVNIALVNELSDHCRLLGINVWEVVEAAATKPFGFMSFLPGPGAGGHCIPVDPLFLAAEVHARGKPARFIQLADEINSQRPHQIVKAIVEGLNQRQKPVNGSRICIVGVGYKKGSGDLREAPSLKILAELNGFSAELWYVDPYVLPGAINAAMPEDVAEIACRSMSEVAKSDCVAILTDHPRTDYGPIREAEDILVVDACNALKGRYGRDKWVCTP